MTKLSSGIRVRVPRRGNKFGAKPTRGTDGFRYDSKRERNYGESLLLRQRAGEIRLLLRQVPFYLPGNVKLVLDFLWIDGEGTVHFEDVKSPPTEKLATFRAKKRMVEHLYDIEIEVVW